MMLILYGGAKIIYFLFGYISNYYYLCQQNNNNNNNLNIMENTSFNLGNNQELANKFSKVTKLYSGKEVYKTISKKQKKEAMKIPYNEKLAEEEVKLLKDNGYKYDKKKKCYTL